jgi:hypothetical protein
LGGTLRSASGSWQLALWLLVPGNWLLAAADIVNTGCLPIHQVGGDDQIVIAIAVDVSGRTDGNARGITSGNAVSWNPLNPPRPATLKVAPKAGATRDSSVSMQARLKGAVFIGLLVCSCFGNS